MERTFLVADDDFVFWLSALAGTAGQSRSCQVDFIGGVTQCWSRLATQSFSAVFLDVQHLQVDDVSRALLHDLRQAQPELRIIGFARRPSKRVDAAARQLGVDLLVCKRDCDPAVLAQTLTALIPAAMDFDNAVLNQCHASFA